MEGTVPKVRQITAMNYKSPQELRTVYVMFHAQNCVLLSLQSFLCARQRCVNEDLFIQGPFDNVQGLLGKIQGLFKDLSKFFNFQGLFKGLMLFRGLFKAHANHGSQGVTPKPRPRRLQTSDCRPCRVSTFFLVLIFFYLLLAPIFLALVTN